LLNISCRLDASADTFGWLANSISTQLFVIHAWNFDAASPCQSDRAADQRCVFDTL
jgi:hypothetical protein